jgi:hypothetical protein
MLDRQWSIHAAAEVDVLAIVCWNNPNKREIQMVIFRMKQ